MSKRKDPVSVRIVAIRKALGVNQAKFAEMANVSLGTVEGWESDRPPAGRILYRLANWCMKQHFAGAEELWAAAIKDGFPWGIGMKSGVDILEREGSNSETTRKMAQAVEAALSILTMDEFADLRAELEAVLDRVIRSSYASGPICFAGIFKPERKGRVSTTAQEKQRRAVNG